MPTRCIGNKSWIKEIGFGIIVRFPRYGRPAFVAVILLEVSFLGYETLPFVVRSLVFVLPPWVAPLAVLAEMEVLIVPVLLLEMTKGYPT